MMRKQVNFAFDIRHSKFEIPSDGIALQSRHAAVLLQRARGGAFARTRAGAEPRFVESLWREIENGRWRIALRLRLPRGARGNRPVAAPRRFAPDRPRQRTRLPKPDALADVFVRGKAAPENIGARSRRGPFSILYPRRARGFEAAANRPGTNLALVLAASRRIFCGALPLPSRRAQRLDARRVHSFRSSVHS